MDYKLTIIVILAIGFALASFLGYVTQRIKLPSILGYLIAGYIIGPYSPGYEANLHVSEQLAEIGVVLMLFGVGLHFKLEDLIKVKNIALPGALLQMILSSTATVLLLYNWGWSIESGTIIGMSIGVASTVVLIRILTENNLLDTKQGHIAVGWLVVEDIMTVVLLASLPMMAQFFKGGDLSAVTILSALGIMATKLAVLVAFMFTLGQKLVERIMKAIARMHSQELFTLTILALTFLVAIVSSFLLDLPITFGAFISGMVIGKTEVRYQAAANSLPLKDAFAVIFFLSIGMLFNPILIAEHFSIFMILLGTILIIKPLIALVIVLAGGYSFKIALTIALALAQIGEFSFILAEQAISYDLLPDTGDDLLIACALVSISLNPLLFRLINYMAPDQQRPVSALKVKYIERSQDRLLNLFQMRKVPTQVIVVGYGTIGKKTVQTLDNLGYKPIVIEQNIDTVSNEKDSKIEIVFGDAASHSILEATKLAAAKLLIITPSNTEVTKSIIYTAREINPDIRILAHSQKVDEIKVLKELKVSYICSEKETIKAFTDLVRHIVKHI